MLMIIIIMITVILLLLILLLLPEPAKVMFWSACIYLFISLYVCMLPTFLKNYWTELHEIFIQGPIDFILGAIRSKVKVMKRSKNYWTELHENFRDDLSSSKDQSFRFWE